MSAGVRVDDIGEVLQWAEFWLLICAGCGHEQYVPRNHWNYDVDQMTAELRTYYAECQACAHPLVRPAPN